MDFLKSHEEYKTLMEYNSPNISRKQFNDLHEQLVQYKQKSRTSVSTNRLQEHKEYGFHEYLHTDVDKMSSDKQDTDEFRLSPNQQFLKKFMSPNTLNRSLLLFHGVGVGKTCAAIHIAENFLRFEASMKKCLVILPPALQSNFKREIFDISKSVNQDAVENSCLGGHYLDLLGNAKKYKKRSSDLERAVDNLIKERYTFYGYTEFANKVLKNKRIKDTILDMNYIEYLRLNFSDRLIIVDEVHNIRALGDKTAKQIPIILEHIMKYVNNVRILLLSATPMYDNAKEIQWLVNTMSSNDNASDQYVFNVEKMFDDNEQLTSDVELKLKQFASNYVSYMRGENPFTFPLRLDPSVNKDGNVLTKHPKKDVYGVPLKEEDLVKRTKLVQSTFGQNQLDMYLTLKYSKKDKTKTKTKKNKTSKSEKQGGTQSEETINDDDVDNDEDVDNDGDDDMNEVYDKDEISDKHFQSRIQLSNIIYPSKATNVKLMYGKKGFYNILQKSTHNKSFGLEYKSEAVRIFEQNHLGTYAPKMKRILDYVNKSEGIVLIYSKYLESGVIPMALALESSGYTRYKDGNFLRESEVSNKGKSKGNYVIFSGDPKYGNIDRDLEQVRSSENRDGDLIKVVLMTQKVSEGVDFKNVREVHIMEPWFNMSRNEQIIGRGVRNNSHKDLKDNAKWNVTVYHHVNMFPDDSSSSALESIDYRMYRISEKKQMKISRVERVLKEGAIDCPLNHEVLTFPKEKLNLKRRIVTSQGVEHKNFEIGDVDNDKNCDYESCTLKCSSSYSNEALTDVKDLRLNEKLIAHDLIYMKRDIKKVFIDNWERTEELFMKYKDIEDALIKHKDDKRQIRLLKYALDNLTGVDVQKHPSDGLTLEGIEGRLIYRSSKYIFQPTMVSDERIPLDKRLLRETIRRPRYLSLKQIISGIKTVINNSREVKQKEVNYQQVGETEFNTIKMKLQSYLVGASIDDTIVWSMVIDGFDQMAFRQFVKQIDDMKRLISNPSLLQSMKDSKVFYFDDESKLSKYYDIYKDKYMSYNDNKWNETKQTENRGFLKQLNSELDEKLKQYKEDGMNVLGHMETKPTEKHTYFKIADKKVLESNKNKDKAKLVGLVCHKTSIFTKERMKEYIRYADINNIVAKDKVYISKKTKPDKPDLCTIYEYLLRLRDGLHFMRPMYVKRYNEIDRKEHKEKEEEKKLKKKTEKDTKTEPKKPKQPKKPKKN